jgi:hypothetical protein
MREEVCRESCGHNCCFEVNFANPTMSTKIKDVMRALRPEKVSQYFQNFIYRQQKDLRYHPQGPQRFVFKVMFAAQFIFYFSMYFGWNRKSHPIIFPLFSLE